MNSIAFSCLVDRPRHLMAQCFVWVNCLLEIQKIPPKRIFVHVAGIDDPDFLPWLESLGVNVVRVAPFDARNPYCNTLCQLETFASGEFDQVVLMDCDTAWVGDAPLPRGEPATGKIVDNARPPENVLAGIFRVAGLGEPNWVEASIPNGHNNNKTDRNNFNGGLYILDGQFVAKLAPAWRAWATWCLDRLDSFEQFLCDPPAVGSEQSDGVAAGSTTSSRKRKRPLVPSDQLSFALACRELGVVGRLLPIEWNYPTYSPRLPDVTPQILHYSRQFKPPFKLRRTGISRPDSAIDALNDRIEGFLAKHSTRWVMKSTNSGWKKQVLDFFRIGPAPTSVQ